MTDEGEGPGVEIQKFMKSEIWNSWNCDQCHELLNGREIRQLDDIHEPVAQRQDVVSGTLALL